MVKHMIFDMDGTILDSERFCYQCLREVFRNRGKEFPEEAYIHLIGGTRQDEIKYFQKLYGQSLDYVEVLSALEKLEEEKLARGESIPIKKGYFALRQWLKERGVTMALATSTHSEKARKRLKLVGILEDFDFLVCGDEVVHGKPDPEIYIKILTHYNAKPDEIMVVEDSFNGIKSACRAGLRVIMVPDMILPSEEIRTLAYKTVRNLEEVISVIKDL